MSDDQHVTAHNVLPAIGAIATCSCGWSHRVSVGDVYAGGEVCSVDRAVALARAAAFVHRALSSLR